MRKIYNTTLLFLCFLILLPLASAYCQERITITTYYPAPFGVYKNLRLFPSDEPACKTANEEGTIYYDKTKHTLMMCVQDEGSGFKWQGVGGGFARLTSDPSGTDGMVYFNTESDTLRLFANGKWSGIPRVTTGMYTGDCDLVDVASGGKRCSGKAGYQPRFIAVGFKPRFVLVAPYQIVALEVDNNNVQKQGKGSGADLGAIHFVENGFEINRSITELNYSGQVFSYIAMTW